MVGLRTAGPSPPPQTNRADGQKHLVMSRALFDLGEWWVEIGRMSAARRREDRCPWQPAPRSWSVMGCGWAWTRSTPAQCWAANPRAGEKFSGVAGMPQLSQGDQASLWTRRL